MAGELRKMVEFIKKEADEKAKEIELKVSRQEERREFIDANWR